MKTVDLAGGSGRRCTAENRGSVDTLLTVAKRGEARSRGKRIENERAHSVGFKPRRPLNHLLPK